MGETELSAESGSEGEPEMAQDDPEEELMDPEWAAEEVATAWRRTASSGRLWRRALQNGPAAAWGLWRQEVEPEAKAWACLLYTSPSPRD
eukprot:129187-Alexandrium_andersonii.AAC.1